MIADERLLEKGRILYNLKKYTQAEKVLREALVVNINNEATLRLLGYTLYQLDKYKEAYDISNQLLLINPQNLYAFKIRVLLHIGRSEYEIAEAILVDALNIDPQDAVLWQYQAIVCFKEEKYKQCINCATNTLELGSTDIQTLNIMAWSYFQLSDSRKAHEMLNLSLEMDPNASNTLEAIAWFEYFKKDEERKDLYKIKSMFENALTVDPTSKPAQYGLKLTNTHLQRSNLPTWLIFATTITATIAITGFVPLGNSLKSFVTALCNSISAFCIIALLTRWRRDKYLKKLYSSP